MICTLAIELFAGIGGFRLAADSLGIETVWANDIDAQACAVYRDRFGEGVIVNDDIKLEDVPTVVEGWRGG